MAQFGELHHLSKPRSFKPKTRPLPKFYHDRLVTESGRKPGQSRVQAECWPTVPRGKRWKIPASAVPSASSVASSEFSGIFRSLQDKPVEQPPEPSVSDSEAEPAFSPQQRPATAPALQPEEPEPDPEGCMPAGWEVYQLEGGRKYYFKSDDPGTIFWDPPWLSGLSEMSQPEPAQGPVLELLESEAESGTPSPDGRKKHRVPPWRKKGSTPSRPPPQDLASFASFSSWIGVKLKHVDDVRDQDTAFALCFHCPS